MDFEQAYQIGRLRAYFLGFKRKNQFLLPLDDVLRVAPPLEKRYIGMQDIPVKRVIGVEDRSRSEDFSAGFYPVRANMRERWNTVQKLLLGDNLPEAIQVIECGGYYFVRDGNHRVSVARANGIEFLTAEVTQYRLPIKLLPRMTPAKLPLLKAKYAFYQATKAFDALPEEHFYVARPETWQMLEHEIAAHRLWWIEKNHREPEQRELALNWNAEIYESTIMHIRLHSLPQLFPGKLETDIYADIMRFWDTFPPGTWFLGVYDEFIRNARRKRWLLAAPHWIRQTFKRLFMNEDEARELFLHVSRLRHFRPNAFLPKGGAAWYRFLTHQLIVSHFAYLRGQLGREPHMHELTGDWYDRMLLPCYELYQQQSLSIPFPDVYMDWMKTWKRLIVKESAGVMLPRGFVVPETFSIDEPFTIFQPIILPERSEGLVTEQPIHLPEGAMLPQGTTLPTGTRFSGMCSLPTDLTDARDDDLQPGDSLEVAATLRQTFRTPVRIMLPTGAIFRRSVQLPECAEFPSGMTFPQGTLMPLGLCLPKRVNLPENTMFPAQQVLLKEITEQDSFDAYLREHGWQKRTDKARRFISENP